MSNFWVGKVIILFPKLCESVNISLVFNAKVELSEELWSNVQKKALEMQGHKCFGSICVCMLSVLEFKLLLDPYIIILSPLQNFHCSLLD